MRRITGFQVIDHARLTFAVTNRGWVRIVTETTAAAPESMDMPSTTLRQPIWSTRTSKPASHRRHFARPACLFALRASVLAVLFAVGLQSEALAQQSTHFVFFRPSPSPDVVGYMLHLGTEAGAYTQEIDLGHPNTVHNVMAYATNVDTGTDLYFALSSYNAEGVDSVYSNEYMLAAAVPTEPGPEPEPEPEPSDQPAYLPDPTPDPGHGSTLASYFSSMSLGITSDATGLISAIRGDGSTFGLTIDSLAAARDLRPTRCDLDGDGDSDLVLGFGQGGDGQVALIHLEDEAVASVGSVVVGDATYRSTDGSTYPACGDVDGDGRNELVIGTGPEGDAELAVFDSSDTGFAPFDTGAGGMISAPATGRMRNDGTGVVPALGDFDGDGRDELVVGFTAPGHRSIAILDDGLRAFARHESLQNGNGLVRVARAEDDDNQGGGTYPALGDWDGDGLAEFAIGYGAGSDGWMLFMDDGLNTRLDRYPTFLRVQVGREAIRSSSGAVRPAFGDIDGDGLDEIVVSFGLEGSYELQVFDDQFTGSTNLFRGGAGFIAADDENVRLMAAPAR